MAMKTLDDPQDFAVVEKRRRLSRERYARKQVERVDRRKLLGQWMGFTSEAFQALKDMDRLDKQIGAAVIFMMACVSMVGAQSYWVIADTNQLKLIPPNVKVVAMTNLTFQQEFVEVVTNWNMIGPPFDVKDSNGVVIARRVFQVSNLITNRYRIYDETNRVALSQVTGPVLETRTYDIPPPLPTTTSVTIPLRQQR